MGIEPTMPLLSQSIIGYFPDFFSRSGRNERTLARRIQVHYSCRVMQRLTTTTYPASSGFVVVCAG
jgi:hypothetical protein